MRDLYFEHYVSLSTVYSVRAQLSTGHLNQLPSYWPAKAQETYGGRKNVGAKGFGKFYEMLSSGHDVVIVLMNSLCLYRTYTRASQPRV